MKKILVILFLVFCSFAVSAERVGLVLSGGGAKGLYHVGVIKALEESGIPIDYISGASMGAIVGALYASGYSPDEMIEFFVTDSVSAWLTGKLPEQYRSYFNRFEPTPEMVSINMNPDSTFSKSLQLPTNIISPYPIDLAFMNMITPSSIAADDDFNNLMIPFRCNAWDPYNEKEIVFDEGSLAFAVRASMTIPGAFTPLILDSVLVYDGGLFNNFPWQSIESEFNPDILIGSICAGNYTNPKRDDLIGQLSVMVSSHTDYRLPDSGDVIIRRKLADVSPMDYNKAPYIIALGYEDAMEQVPEILKRIERRVTPEELELKRQEFKSRVKPLVFEQVIIEGLTPGQTEYVMRQLGISRDQIVDADYFQRKYMRILAAGVFTADFPEITYNPETGYSRLRIKMYTRPSMKLSLGGNLSSSSLNQLYIGFQYRTVGHSASTYRAEGYLGILYNSIGVGGRHDLYTQFPFYIDYTYGYETKDPDTYSASSYYKNQRWRYKAHNNNYVTSSIAIPVFENSAFRGRVSFGVRNDKYYQDYFTAADKMDHSRFTYGQIGVEIQNHTLNHALFANKGVDQIFSMKYNTGLERYVPGSTAPAGAEFFKMRNRNWFELRFMRTQYIEASNWFTFGYLIDATYSNMKNMANPFITAMLSPSFSPTPTSKALFMPEYTSASYAAAGVIPVFNFIHNTFYLKTYTMAFLPRKIVWQDGWRGGNIWNRVKDKSEYIFGGSLVYQTLIGPASLTVEKYTTGPRNWNVMLNFGWMLFRKYPH